MLYSLGIQMVRYRWLVIGLWAALFVVAAALAPRAVSSMSGGGRGAGAGAHRGGGGLGGAGETALAPVLARPEVRVVLTAYNASSPGLVSDDGRTSYAIIGLDSTIDEALDSFPQFRKELLTPPGFQMWTTGGIAIFAD